ncbi:hypothetical protein [Paenibacillus sp. YIM B09110]|uniref:hypothetical protein n=1 Tax=Paenibacillus sp. YIM B09110 TaxID=3126102 RepID=UPI00301BB9AD
MSTCIAILMVAAATTLFDLKWLTNKRLIISYAVIYALGLTLGIYVLMFPHTQGPAQWYIRIFGQLSRAIFIQS